MWDEGSEDENLPFNFRKYFKERTNTNMHMLLLTVFLIRPHFESVIPSVVMISIEGRFQDDNS